MAAARNETDREQTSQQLDAFHKTFNFCMTCRQYTCGNCWNEAEGRCLSCAPNLGQEIMPAPFGNRRGGRRHDADRQRSRRAPGPQRPRGARRRRPSRSPGRRPTSCARPRAPAEPPRGRSPSRADGATGTEVAAEAERSGQTVAAEPHRGGRARGRGAPRRPLCPRSRSSPSRQSRWQPRRRPRRSPSTSRAAPRGRRRARDPAAPSPTAEPGAVAGRLPQLEPDGGRGAARRPRGRCGGEHLRPAPALPARPEPGRRDRGIRTRPGRTSRQAVAPLAPAPPVTRPSRSSRRPSCRSRPRSRHPPSRSEPGARSPAPAEPFDPGARAVLGRASTSARPFQPEPVAPVEPRRRLRPAADLADRRPRRPDHRWHPRPSPSSSRPSRPADAVAASAEPQWPATPEWPEPRQSQGLPFLGRPAAADGRHRGPVGRVRTGGRAGRSPRATSPSPAQGREAGRRPAVRQLRAVTVRQRPVLPPLRDTPGLTPPLGALRPRGRTPSRSDARRSRTRTQAAP